ncbi:agamous-like MADS-box protein AGL80 [Canna indica]|uniref:Agamous-like MADS-box protein AGL80 n=1 Tax=Canna indica TaxID=4628 RepID=A0AAQ3QEG3_9LILI|nr:agamous-like MADS-box protein AGL80 [Canna indica]
MARKKVKLAWISNDATRRATYKKRKHGLLKKVRELTTLCHVTACMIVYGPEEAQPEAWPSAAEAAPVIRRFKSMPDMDQCRKMVNQEGFLRQRVGKLQEQLRRLMGDNRELEASLLMHEVLGGGGGGLVDVGVDDARRLAWMAEVRLKVVEERIRSEAAHRQLAVKEEAEMASKEEEVLRQNPGEEVDLFHGGEEIMPISYAESSMTWLQDAYNLFPLN